MLRKINLRTIPIHFNSNHTFEGNVLFKCEDSYYCEVIVPESEIFIQLSKENNFSATIDVTVLAKFVGFNELEVVMNDTVTEHILAKVFTAVTAIFIFFVTFLMGTQLSIDCIWQIMKRPVGPLTGFFCQFGVMPLVAYGLAKTILPSEDKALQFSLFAAGCSPGGGKSSFWTIIFNGNLDLSVSMTLTQTIGAMAMMPLWIYTLGSTFFDERIQVPFLSLSESLASLIIPSALGMIFIHYKRHLMEKCRRWIKIATWIATFAFTAFGCYVNTYVFYLFTWRIIACACIQPWCGYIIAYFIAWIFKQNHTDRLTIAIETGVQNIGIAMIMLMFSLPEPEVDIAIVQPIAILLTTDKPLLIMYFIRKLYRKCKSKKTVPTENVKYHHNLWLNGDSPSSTPKKISALEANPKFTEINEHNSKTDLLN
uniref:Uncharacterized protein n=1 Tax=Panagrolaimus davidi TaxID=227884 RepID=A0A914QJH0_9BILA